MKNLRRLLPALCLLLISAMCAGTSTYAWFTMNNTVDATGMKVKAEASGSLVIGTGTLNANSEGTSVDFKMATGTALIPAIYEAKSAEDSTMVLKTIKDEKKKFVSPVTGLINNQAVSGSDLTETAPAGKKMSTSFDVYIGCQGETVTDVTLTISASVETSTVGGALKAIVTVGSETPVVVDLGSGIGTVTGINPAMCSAGGTHVTVEVFIDGNKTDNNGNAYVHTKDMVLDDMTIGLVFSAD